jgi:D-glycerate 3-kinase
MACVIEWRTQQEKQLAAQSNSAESRLMESSSLERFIMHFERITRHNLTQLPPNADVVLTLNHAHDFSAVQLKSTRPTNS